MIKIRNIIVENLCLFKSFRINALYFTTFIFFNMLINCLYQNCPMNSILDEENNNCICLKNQFYSNEDNTNSCLGKKTFISNFLKINFQKFTKFIFSRKSAINTSRRLYYN